MTTRAATGRALPLLLLGALALAPATTRAEDDEDGSGSGSGDVDDGPNVIIRVSYNVAFASLSVDDLATLEASTITGIAGRSSDTSFTNNVETSGSGAGATQGVTVVTVKFISGTISEIDALGLAQDVDGNPLSITLSSPMVAVSMSAVAYALGDGTTSTFAPLTEDSPSSSANHTALAVALPVTALVALIAVVGAKHYRAGRKTVKPTFTGRRRSSMASLEKTIFSTRTLGGGRSYGSAYEESKEADTVKIGGHGGDMASEV